MKKLRKTIGQRVIFQLADFTDRDDLSVEMRLREDLGLDSLDLVQLQTGIEDELDIETDDKLFWGALTIQELIVVCGGNPNFKGLICPDCGAEDKLAVEGKTLWRLGPHEYDNEGYDIEIHPDNFATCGSCDWEGCFQDLKQYE